MLHAKRTASSDTSGEIQGLNAGGWVSQQKNLLAQMSGMCDTTNEKMINHMLLVEGVSSGHGLETGSEGLHC